MLFTWENVEGAGGIWYDDDDVGAVWSTIILGITHYHHDKHFATKSYHYHAVVQNLTGLVLLLLECVVIIRCSYLTNRLLTLTRVEFGL